MLKLLERESTIDILIELRNAVGYMGNKAQAIDDFQEKILWDKEFRILDNAVEEIKDL